MSDLYFRQLLAGEAVARSNAAANQMRNFMYLIGDPESREAMVVDPAWDVDGLLRLAAEDGYEVTGALLTHYHPDHVGGDLFGLEIEGVRHFLEKNPAPLYANKLEVAGMQLVTGASTNDFRPVEGGDVITIGAVPITFLHTPGHTPGSQCFLVGDRLVAGDTLFVQGCGRVDLPGGDPDAMYYTLTQKLAKLPPETILYPGHHYGPTPTSTLAAELEQNHYLRIRSLEDWRRMMGMP